MIELKHITKYYGKKQVVNDVSFEVGVGQILGFLGPNGAGKSTTMKMLTSFIRPTSGDAWIDGYSVISQSLKTRAMIGYLPENSPSYKDMRVKEFLNFIADVRKIGASNKKKRIDLVIDQTLLGSVYHQTIETLSKGFKQRVGLAQALLHDPEVLILDEPTDGLDPNQKLIVRKLIKDISPNKAIILSTHVLEEMEAVCTKALIINNGKLVANGTTEELLKMSDNYNAVKIRLEKTIDKELQNIFSLLPEVEEVRTSDDKKSLLILPKDKKSILALVIDQIKTKNIPISDIQLDELHMDIVFRKLTHPS